MSYSEGLGTVGSYQGLCANHQKFCRSGEKERKELIKNDTINPLETMELTPICTELLIVILL